MQEKYTSMCISAKIKNCKDKQCYTEVIHSVQTETNPVIYPVKYNISNNGEWLDLLDIVTMSLAQ